MNWLLLVATNLVGTDGKPDTKIIVPPLGYIFIGAIIGIFITVMLVLIYIILKKIR